MSDSINDPEFLIVDEPTVGLDPGERVRLRNALSNTATGRVVILSTHIVPDVESTADTLVFLDNGTVVSHTTVDELLERVSETLEDAYLDAIEDPNVL